MRLRTCSANGEPPGSRVEDAVNPFRAQGLGQQAGLRGFTGALAAFEGDEPTRWHNTHWPRRCAALAGCSFAETATASTR